LTVLIENSVLVVSSLAESPDVLFIEAVIDHW
jgi:hypothetical protein